MCGIAGIIASRDVVPSALARITLAQRHRGPDDAGEERLDLDRRMLGFGHRRLAILDLSPAGHQPMVNPRTGDQIIFNGEIYNFAELRQELTAAGETFQGHCDTEILLYGLGRFGRDYLKRLAGMYALAFYNAREKSLLLARDPLGIKPLYVARTASAFLFASEVRAILASGLVAGGLDPQGLASFLAYGAVQQPCTIFQAIRSFPPGSAQQIHLAGPTLVEHAVEPFWRFPAPNPRAGGEQDVIAAIRAAMDLSVQQHLVADVPVGVFLSSGIDSTVLAGLAAKHTPHLRAFTVGFADQPDMSEMTLAKQTAELFGLDHTEVIINGADAQKAAADWLLTLDQPSIDGLNVYLISKAVRNLGITVALSGQGGDELFGGYPSFSDVPQLHRWMRYMSTLPVWARLAICRAATMRRSPAVRQKLADIMRTDGSLRELYFQRRRAMSAGQLQRLGINPRDLGLTQNFQPPEALTHCPVDEGDPTWSLSCLESAFYQGNMLLRDSDTNGMAHALEIRVPFLDQRVIDLAYALPGRLRMPTPEAKKHLLRKGFAEFLRPALLAQGKRGFTLPISRWMIGPLRDMCEDALADLRALGLLNPQGIDSVWGAYLQNPDSPIWSRAFMLVVFGTYLRNIRTLRQSLPAAV